MSLSILLQNIIQQDNSPQALEGYWYYIRVFGPMIGALLSGWIAFKVAMKSFNKSQNEQKRKEEERILNLRKLLLNELTNLVLHFYEQIIVMDELNILAQSYKISKSIEDFNHEFFNVTSDVLTKINGEDIYKAIIYKKENFTDEDDNKISLFFKCLYRLNKDNKVLLKTFHNFTEAFKKWDEIKRIYMGKIMEEYKILDYPKNERDEVFIWYKNFTQSKNNFSLFLSQLQDKIKNIQTEQFKFNLQNYVNTLNINFNVFLSNYEIIISQTFFYVGHYKSSLYNFNYIVENFYSPEEINKYRSHLLENEVDIKNYIDQCLKDDEKFDEQRKSSILEKKQIIKNLKELFEKQKEAMNKSDENSKV